MEFQTFETRASEIKKSLQLLEESRKKLHEEMRALEASYTEHSPLKVGQKVIATVRVWGISEERFKDVIAYVREVKPGFNEKKPYHYSFFKSKADGTVSKNNHWDVERFTPCE